MEMVTLPAAVLFGTMIGLGVTGFLLAKETRPWYIYILLALVNCIISILVYAGTACEAVQGAAMCIKAQKGGGAWAKSKIG